MTSEGAGTEKHGQVFKQLQVLSLEDNKIGDWEEVMQLAGLSSLTSLSLSDNPLPSIPYPASTSGTDATGAGSSGQEQAQQPVAFAALQRLYLASCRLSSWSDVDALNRFPVLRELRLTGNPVLATAKGGGRYEVGRHAHVCPLRLQPGKTCTFVYVASHRVLCLQIVGRVAGLLHLNGAEIRPRERRDAELRYLQVRRPGAWGITSRVAMLGMMVKCNKVTSPASTCLCL